ncbi:hypothetical protein KBC70_00280 [Candidatus Woesebacteria bacterium]|nr:hypothetical protein [Candidatus Woesebacteria bacterium]
MKIEINLLQNQKNYKKLEDAFKIFRLSVVLVAFVTFLTLIILFALRRNADATLTSTIKARNNVVDAIQQKEDQEAQILLIQEKIQTMNKVLSEVPDYSRQVETILAFMPVASESGKLSNISIDGNTSQVSLQFPNINALTLFLKTVDSKSFQSTFEEIELSTISYTDPTKQLNVQLNVGFKEENN